MHPKVNRWRGTRVPQIDGVSLATLESRDPRPGRTGYMTHLCRLIALVLASLSVAPTLASAGVGDYKTITGQITMWAPSRFDEQIAVVRDDEGQRWVVRFGPDTLPAGSAIGTEVTVMGRETAFANELSAVGAMLTSSVSALPAGAASGWAVVPGAVQDASGTTAVIRANGGAVVT